MFRAIGWSLLYFIGMSILPGVLFHFKIEIFWCGIRIWRRNRGN